MVKQYRTLSKCGLYMLEQRCRGTVVSKIESRIYRAKILLLDDMVGWMVNGDRSNEALFEELYVKLQAAFGSSVPDVGAVDEVVRHLDKIYKELRWLFDTRPSRISGSHPCSHDQILVQHPDLSVAYLRHENLELLLESDRIIRFRRNEGWVDPKSSPLRKIQQSFSNPDRRRTADGQSAV